jgi:hypothetical protein
MFKLLVMYVKPSFVAQAASPAFEHIQDARHFVTADAGEAACATGFVAPQHPA